MFFGAVCVSVCMCVCVLLGIIISIIYTYLYERGSGQNGKRDPVISSEFNNNIRFWTFFGAHNIIHYSFVFFPLVSTRSRRYKKWRGGYSKQLSQKVGFFSQTDSNNYYIILYKVRPFKTFARRLFLQRIPNHKFISLRYNVLIRNSKFAFFSFSLLTHFLFFFCNYY